MKRSRAILLFGLMSIVVGGYFAWCARGFYLLAEMPDLSDVPTDALSLVQQEIERSGLRRPEEFDFEMFWDRLGDPYDSQPVQICVLVDEGERIIGVRSDRGVVFWLSKESGRWGVTDP